MNVFFWVLLVGFGLSGLAGIEKLENEQGKAWNVILIVISIIAVAISAGYLFGGLDVTNWFK